MCVREGDMKMVLTCMEASLCVSICCGPDSSVSVCLVCAEYGLFTSLRCLSRIVGQWSVCYVAQAVVLVGRTFWAIVGCCCDELHYISPYVTGYILYYCTVATC